MRLREVRFTQMLAATLILASYFTAGCGPAIAGQDIDQRAVERASNYLNLAATGEGILNFVHMGADYRGHTFLHMSWVNDSDGYRVSGQFALVYRFRWEDDGVTDLVFLCNERGGIYDVQVVSTNARWNQPFLFANAAIQILGNLVIDNNKNEMTRAQFQLARQLIDKADSRGLLKLAMILGEK